MLDSGMLNSMTKEQLIFHIQRLQKKLKHRSQEINQLQRRIEQNQHSFNKLSNSNKAMVQEMIGLMVKIQFLKQNQKKKQEKIEYYLRLLCKIQQQNVLLQNQKHDNEKTIRKLSDKIENVYQSLTGKYRQKMEEKRVLHCNLFEEQKKKYFKQDLQFLNSVLQIVKKGHNRHSSEGMSIKIEKISLKKVVSPSKTQKRRQTMETQMPKCAKNRKSTN